MGGGPNKFIPPPPCGGERRGAARRRLLGELRKNNRPTKIQTFPPPPTPTARAAAAAAAVKNVMKPREGEDGRTGMNPTPNERRRCRHSGPPESAPIHGPGGAGNVEALRRRDRRMNRQGRSGVRRGRPHGGAAPWAGASFSAHGEVADVRRSRRHRLRERPGRWCGGRAGPLKVADCGATAVKSVRCQGNEAKEGILAVRGKLCSPFEIIY